MWVEKITAIINNRNKLYIYNKQKKKVEKITNEFYEINFKNLKLNLQRKVIKRFVGKRLKPNFSKKFFDKEKSLYSYHGCKHVILKQYSKSKQKASFESLAKTIASKLSAASISEIKCKNRIEQFLLTWNAMNKKKVDSSLQLRSKINPKIIRNLKITRKYHKLIIDPATNDYLYPLVFNGTTVQFIVDTGSPISLISKKMFLTCYPNGRDMVNTFDNGRNISGYTGHKVNCFGTAELPCNIPGYGILNHLFTITSDDLGSIMGRDMLNLLKAEIVCDKNPQNTYIKFKKTNRTAKLKEYRGATVSDITLDPLIQRHEHLILKLEVGHSLQKGMEYEFISSVPYNDVVIPSISKGKCLGKSLSIPIILSNSSSNPQMLSRGTLISLVPIKNKQLMNVKEVFPNENMNSVLEVVKKKRLYIERIIVNKEVDNDIAEELSTFFEYKTCFIKSLKENLKQGDTRNDNNDGLFQEDIELNPEERIGISMEPENLTQVDIEDHFKDYPEDIRKELISIFKDNPAVVSQHAFDMGKCSKKVDIELAYPVPRNTKTYPLNNEKMIQLRNFLDYLEFYKIIKKCDEKSQYGSPCFVVGRKGKDTGCRLIIDSREANKSIAGSVSAVMNSVHEEVLSLSQDLIMLTALDLRQAYYALELSEETLESGLSNILTPWGSYQCLRGLTGWSRLPTWFNTFLREELDFNNQGEYSPLFPKTVPFYDDVNQPRRLGESLDSHLKNVRSLIERLARCGFKINLNKSHFCVDTRIHKVNVLGFLVGYNSVSVNPIKIQALKELGPPKNVKQLQSFLGSINFFRQLLPLRASHALSILPKKIVGTKLFWDEEAKIEFEAVKKSLGELVICRNTENTINLLYTDASKYCLGSICFSIPLEILEIKPQNLQLEFQEVINTNLKASLQRSSLNLKVLKSGIDLITCLYETAEVMKLVHFKTLNQFKRTLFTRITLMAKTLQPTFYDHGDPALPGILRSFENLTFNPNLNLPPTAEHFLLLAFNEMIGRQVLIINDVTAKKEYFYLGHPSKYSPIVLFYCKDTLMYFFLGSSESFLSHDATVINYNSEVSGDDVVKGFHKYLKRVTYENQDSLGRRVTILGFYSKAFSKTDIAKSVYEKEALSIFRSLIFFRNETLISKTFVLTDSTPAHALFNVKGNQKNKKVLNIHLSLLTEFSHVGILSVPGKKMLGDFMSRCGVNEIMPEELNIMPTYVQNESTGQDDILYFKDFSSYYGFLESLSLEKTKVNNIKINIIQESLLMATYNKFINDASFQKCTMELLNDSQMTLPAHVFVENGILYNDLAQRVIPPALEFIYISLYHVTRAHRTSLGLFKLITRDFGVLNKKAFMDKIDIFVSSCVSCYVTKPNRLKHVQGNIFLDVVRPVQYLSLDYMEEHQTPGNYKVKQRLVIVDHFSSKIFVYFYPAATDNNTITALLNFFSQHGVPQAVLTDKASYFGSEKFKTFLKKFGVKLVDSSPRKSSSRGTVERAIGKIREVVSLLGSTSRFNDYIDLTVLAVRILNSTCETKLELSPNELFSGGGDISKPFLTQEHLGQRLSFDAQSEQERRVARRNFNIKIKEVILKRKQEKLKRLAKFNKGRTKLRLEPGNFVLVKTWDNRPGIKESSYYSRIPHLVVQAYEFQVVCKNIVTGANVKRHISHVKHLKVDKIRKLQLPKEIIDSLDLFEVSDFVPVSKPLQELPQKGPITRARAQEKEEDSSSDSGEEGRVTFLLPYTLDD